MEIKIIKKLLKKNTRKYYQFNNDSDLFALERDRGLKSIIKNIYATFDSKDVYLSVEEKAANFLYLITKNHTFIDGNKRMRLHYLFTF